SWILRARAHDAPRLHDLPLAPEAWRARQPLLPREDARAAHEHYGSPPPCPGADPLRRLRLPLPLPEPVHRQRRLSRHAALLHLPDPPARDIYGDWVRLSALLRAPSLPPRSAPLVLPLPLAVLLR